MCSFESLCISFGSFAACCIVLCSFIGRIDPGSRGSPVGWVEIGCIVQKEALAQLWSVVVSFGNFNAYHLNVIANMFISCCVISCI